MWIIVAIIIPETTTIEQSNYTYPQYELLFAKIKYPHVEMCKRLWTKVESKKNVEISHEQVINKLVHRDKKQNTLLSTIDNVRVKPI